MNTVPFVVTTDKQCGIYVVNPLQKHNIQYAIICMAWY